MILARSTSRIEAVRERTKVEIICCSSSVNARNFSGCLMCSASCEPCLISSFHLTTDFVIAPLRRTSQKNGELRLQEEQKLRILSTSYHEFIPSFRSSFSIV